MCKYIMPSDYTQNNNSQQKKKMVIGWFSFTCCEDSTILFTELLNDNYDAWSKIIEFRHLNALKSNNRLEDLDVAFVEGAISSPTQESEVIKIRQNSKFVVAIGSCACTGLPSASRNELIDNEMSEKIKWYFDNFDYSIKVRKLDEVIKVDDWVDGCPMSVNKFYEVLNKYLEHFGVA
jgi:sulfhydrogenase subunit delta